MARVAAILKALARAFRRDWGSIASISGNVFFPVAIYFLGPAGAFAYLLVALIMLLPMSTDPLRKIPPSRLALWPLSRREHLVLRTASPWLNPLTWLVGGFAVWSLRHSGSWSLWALVAGMVVAGFIVSALPWNMSEAIWRMIPSLPLLIRKNVREIVSTLDFYLALLLSLSALVYRMTGGVLPPEGRLAITLLVVLALATYAQCLFGLDGAAGKSRYRLLPLRGWQLLAAKDVAYLFVTAILSLPLAPWAGIAAALISLAAGHSLSIGPARPQRRWRFSSGPLVPALAQVAAMVGAAAAVFFQGAWVLGLCVAVWAVSTWVYGGRMERGADTR